MLTSPYAWFTTALVPDLQVSVPSWAYAHQPHESSRLFPIRVGKPQYHHDHLMAYKHASEATYRPKMLVDSLPQDFTDRHRRLIEYDNYAYILSFTK